MQTPVKERVRAVYANAQHRQSGKERKKEEGKSRSGHLVKDWAAVAAHEQGGRWVDGKTAARAHRKGEKVWLFDTFTVKQNRAC